MRTIYIGAALIVAGCFRPNAAIPHQENWSLQLPRSLHGPIRASLNPDPSQSVIRITSDGTGLVGITWLRHPLRDYKSGSLVGMALLSQEGTKVVDFLPEVGELSGFAESGRLLGSIGVRDNEWRVLLSLWPLKGARDRTKAGLAVAPFDARGWGSPRVVVPDVLPAPLSFDPSSYIFPRQDGWDLFWVDNYNLPSDLPSFMGGRQRRRLQYARLEDEKSNQLTTAYIFPQFRRAFSQLYEEDLQLVRLSESRYDLIFQESKLKEKSMRRRLMHVRDAMGGNAGDPSQIGRCELLARVVALPLTGERMQLLWLEEIELDEEGRIPPIIRLVEAHLQDRRWSAPLMIAEHGLWYFDSLAGTTFTMRGEQRILAIWQGETRRLTYTVGSTGGKWSNPTVTDLTIGRRNWLVSCSSGLFLITQLDCDLFWTFFEVPTSR